MVLWVFLLLALCLAGAGGAVWLRSPLDELNAEMSDRIETTRATLYDLPDPRPLRGRR